MNRDPFEDLNQSEPDPQVFEETFDWGYEIAIFKRFTNFLFNITSKIMKSVSYRRK